MTIAEMRERIAKARAEFEPTVARCMAENKHEMVDSVREQLYSGIDGRGAALQPSYSQDPWFSQRWAGYYDDEAERWVSCFMHPERYIEWKRRITPPVPGERLGLPARGEDQPNLFIDGTFHRSIGARATEKGVELFTDGWDSGPLVERKYGSQIFALSEPAVRHFNANFLWPLLRQWYARL